MGITAIIGLLTTVLPYITKVGGIVSKVSDVLKISKEEDRDPTPEEIAMIDELIVDAEAGWADIVDAAKARLNTQ